MAGPIDQGFRAYKAKLETTVAPFDPFAATNSPLRGDPDDPASYVQRPGVDFFRPWLAIRGGVAFQWPLGLEGYSLTIDPTLGIHKFIGDNKVVVDVLHAGEEHFTMTGNFPGNSAPKLIQALRDVVYRKTGEEGKILCIPEIMTHAQRVHVFHADFDRDPTARGRDATYSIEFVRLGTVGGTINTTIDPPPLPVTVQHQGKNALSVRVDAKHNSLRKIAAWKLGAASKWKSVYRANEQFFIKNNIAISKAPDYRLPLGMTVYY